MGKLIEKVLEDQRRSIQMYGGITIIGSAFCLFYWLNPNEMLGAGSVLCGLGALFALISILLILVWGESLAVFIGIGWSSLVLFTIGAGLVIFGNWVVSIGLGLVFGGIAMVIAYFEKKIPLAIVGWVVFFVGLYILKLWF